MWRAIRYGMDGKMIDLERGGRGPGARGARARCGRGRRPRASEARIDVALDGPTGAQRQRAALLEGGDLREVYADTVRETMTTYAQEVPA